MSQSFTDLGLIAELVRSVADEGYSIPTPIQAQAIPVILAGRDVLAAAQTGTGKTAGFTLPLLQRLHAAPLAQRAPRSVRALVLTPTRELAAQVEEAIRTYGRHLKLSSALVFGGVGINPQIDAMRRGVDVLVATPGRLLDHLQQKTIDLGKVEVLVLDEADRMLDMGFIRDIRRILAVLPKQRQNLLFSATFSDEIRGLANGLLNSPALVEVARRNAESELVAQRIHPVDASRKRALLSHLIGRGDWRQVLVFTRTKHGANRLAEQLVQDGISASAIHGNKSQSARTKALASFKQGSIRVLVATDIAARGLDIEELPHVVNYELPNVPEDYVHRIGRTGRAGNNGEAISLVSSDENAYLADIERLIKRRVEREVIAGFEPGTAASAAPPAAPRRAQAQPSGRSGQPERKPRPQAPQPSRKPDPAIATAGAGKAPARSAPPAPRRDNRRQTPALLGNQSRRPG
ncbi:MAG: DEAD/DEAH box helicase [Sterolibacteriaceae bacterium]|uniref:ATP-dependent RNA helicase RhlE n=1 Tax=Candidatus Methylophosphatis roskildensis TaxID=2899263 RepID=A0A9D7E4P4_9PROT|nr:DEAD/DEAH box helicase [Candidatus Methylophosphatis roskildensis]